MSCNVNWKAVSSGLLCAGLAFLSCFESVLLASVLCLASHWGILGTQTLLTVSPGPAVAEADVETTCSPMRQKLVSPFADG